MPVNPAEQAKPGGGGGWYGRYESRLIRQNRPNRLNRRGGWLGRYRWRLIQQGGGGNALRSRTGRGGTANSRAALARKKCVGDVYKAMFLKAEHSIFNFKLNVHTRFRPFLVVYEHYFLSKHKAPNFTFSSF